MVQVAQSIPLCILFAASGGVIEVIATAILARQDAQEKAGRIIARQAKYRALALNVILQILASTVGNMIAPWFGPVSIVGPMFLSAQLLANMIIFGRLIGLESFTKDMRVGTYVTVVAAIMLPTVGPQTQEGQDVSALLRTWYALTWVCLMIGGMIVACVFIYVKDMTTSSGGLAERKRIGLLLAARSTAFAVNLTTSKMMVLNPGGLVLGLSIALKVVSGAVQTYAIVVQATAVVQGKFVPLNASALIVTNALTGIIIWEDWAVVQSWLGYACIFCLLFLGNYLLLGELELFTAENSRYGRAGSLLGSLELLRSKATQTQRGDEESNGASGSGGDGIGSGGGGAAGRILRESADAAGESAAVVVEEGSAQAQDDRRPTLTTDQARRDVWLSIYNNDTVHRRGKAYRDRSIFAFDNQDAVLERTTTAGRRATPPNGVTCSSPF